MLPKPKTRTIELYTIPPPARRSPGGPDGAEMLATVFSTAELERGRYLLVLTIVDPAGRSLEARSVPFDIVDS